MVKKNKLCIFSSSGGHFVKTMALKKWWQKYETIWVTRKDQVTNSLLKDKYKVYQAHFPEQRHALNFFKNLWLAFQLLKKEKPDLVFSMGAGLAVHFFFLAKLMNIPTIFMETFIFINHPTLTGKLIYKLNLADIFLVQNKELLETYPQASYYGKII